MLRHRPGLMIFRLVVGLAVLGGAVLVGCRIRESRQTSGEEWYQFRQDLRATACNPIPSAEIPQPYTLRLASIITRASPYGAVPSFFVCGPDLTAGVDLVSTERIRDRWRDWPRVVRRAALGSGASSSLGDGLLLSTFQECPEEDTGFLCWHPELGYESVGAGCSVSAEELFILNYAREALLDQRRCLLSALRAAARGESLRISNRMEYRTADGTVLAAVSLDSNCNPRTAWVAQLNGQTTGLINFNSGYQVSEALYRELMHPRLESGKRLTPIASDRVYGSFRGVLAIDLESDEIVWKRRLGVIPICGVVCDLDRDGLQEIVLSSRAPTNGISASGTTDYWCAYAICLDALGNEVWRHRFCGPYGGVMVAAADVIGDERMEVVATCGSAKDDWSGRLTVLSHDGEVIADVDDYGGMMGLILADVTGDGREEIISGGADGRLFIFDGDLNVVASCTDSARGRYESFRLRPLAANDLDGDGEMEIIALSDRWTVRDWRPMLEEDSIVNDALCHLVVLDGQLREEVRVPVPYIDGRKVVTIRTPGTSDCFVFDLDGDGHNEVVLMAGGVGAYVFEVVAEEE